MSSNISSPYFYLDIPTVEDIKGYFEYQYFSPGESVFPGTSDSTISAATISRFGYPRKIILELSDSLNNLYGRDYNNELIDELLVSDNFSKLKTEPALQNRPSSRVTLNIDEGFLDKNYISSKYSNSNDIYDLALEMINSKDEVDQEEFTRILDRQENNINKINESTNMPVEDFNEYIAKQKTSIVLDNAILDDVISEVSGNGLSPFSDDFYSLEGKTKSMQYKARKRLKNGTINIDDYYMRIDLLENLFLEEVGAIPIGYIVFKTRVSNGQRIRENSIILFERNKMLVEDYSVIYGQDYEYSIHTIALICAKDEEGNLSNFLIISKDSKKLYIKCEEKKPPKPPSDLRFRFLKSTMLLEWDMPIDTNKSGIPIGDIKYVQIFRRKSIEEAFELIRLYDFNDSIVKYSLGEFIPEDIIKNTFMNDNSLELILPERNDRYIYAMCSIDAHGNSSLLGPQYAVYLDNLNRPKVEHIAYPGSMKQYPNLTIVEDYFVDSIKISGYNKLDIYHNPDYTVIVNGESNHEIVSSRETIPSYILQLIDTDLQKEQRIDILMHKNLRVTN